MLQEQKVQKGELLRNSTKQFIIDDDDEDKAQVNNFIKMLSSDVKQKKQNFDISTVISLSPDNNEAQEFFQKFHDISINSEQPEEDFVVPENFQDLVDKQIVQLQNKIMRVVREVNEEMQTQMIKFGGKCCEEVKNQFEQIKQYEVLNEKNLQSRISQACKNGTQMCKAIQIILEKFEDLDKEFVRIKNDYHHRRRRSQIQTAGIMHLRRDKLYYYKRNQTSFQCPMCITRSQTISGLVTHIRKHHKVSVPDGFVCLYCNRPFKIVSQLAPHLWANHRTKKINEYFDCGGCGNSFANKFQTYDHIPKCVGYCAGVNFVLGMQRKFEAKVQQFEQNVENVDDEELEFQ